MATVFEWKSEYETVLDKLASTNIFESDWDELKSMIKYKIDYNVKELLEGQKRPKTPPVSSSAPSSTSSTDAVGPPTPPQTPLILRGLKLPPFPPRDPSEETPVRAMPTQLSEGEAKAMEDEVFNLLDNFDEKPPYTIQRLCELAIRPREHYSVVGKYLRALERTLLVTSTWDEYRLDTYTEDPNAPFSTGTAASREALIHATTPIFSPIPFLNQRGSTHSPPPSPLLLDGGERGRLPGDDPSNSENVPPKGMSMAMMRSLKVDELDHSSSSEAGQEKSAGEGEEKSKAVEDKDGLPKVGRLAEAPEAFSATTTIPKTRTSPTKASRSDDASAVQSRASSVSSNSTTYSSRVSGAPSPSPSSSPPLADRFVRASTPEPSPIRAREEIKREEREEAAAAASASKTSGKTPPKDEGEDVQMGE